MNPRAALVFLHDTLVAAVAWMLAYWLRFNLEVPPPFQRAMLHTLPWVVGIQALLFWRFGLYRGLWRFASLPDLRRILLAVGLSALAAPTLLAVASRLQEVPRAVLLLDPLLLLVFMGGSRFLYRSWKDGHLLTMRDMTATPVLVLGAGEATAQLVKELARSREWRVAGLLDDDPAKQGRMLGGVAILGPLASLPEHARRLRVGHAVISMPSASKAQRRRAAELASAAGLAVLTVPTVEDLMAGRVAISQIRRIELDDLLGRDPVQLDSEGLHRLLTDKVVLVTGAGGSIGAELCRQIASFAPRRLVLYELSEFALYRIEQEFRSRWPGLPIACAVGDVKDAARLAAVFGAQRPAVVFHAAAYKHVPLMEEDNAWEAVRNNVVGTHAVARAAMDHGVGQFVLVSTDKAVNPTNVMGASKRLAEMVCQALQNGGGRAATRFVIVRFGNVLGSSGSVIPTFREQIARGGPVTVTHPEITRYFMLIPEAAQLVLQAGLLASGAEEGGRIFVMDMGEPVKIVDLARDLIRLSGFTEEDIRIEFTGLRPGEKLYEELLADGETTLPTPHPKLRIVKPAAVPGADWLAELLAWLGQAALPAAEVKRGLRLRVPEYRPADNGD